MMKCIEGQGLPTFRDQTEFGNMFLILTIIFPDTIAAESISALKGFLPPALNTVTAKEGAEDVDVFNLVTKKIRSLHTSTTNQKLLVMMMMMITITKWNVLNNETLEIKYTR